MIFRTGLQMSLYGNGSWESVQAPVILILTFGYCASASTFGSSAHGSAGTGGGKGCCRPRWSMTMTVSGFLAASCWAWSRRPQTHVHRRAVLSRGGEDAVDAGVG